MEKKLRLLNFSLCFTGSQHSFILTHLFIGSFAISHQQIKISKLDATKHSFCIKDFFEYNELNYAKGT